MAMMVRQWIGAILFAGAVLCTAPAAASPCTALNGTALENGIVRQAEDVRAGEALTLGGRAISDLPAFCRITASAGVDRRSNITLELWLPRLETWNRKMLGTGNGGFAGGISYDALRGGLKRGYAVVNTDMGTFPASSASWAAGTGHPEMLKDWGYRSTHEMTVVGAALVKLYYREAPRRSYFAGCSTGGHQALMEAQLYPNDYDAILAGAPANNRTRLHLAFLQTGLDVHAGAQSFVPPELLAQVHASILKACVGKDGGAPGDLYLNEPTACRWRPRDMLCKPGNSTGCLNMAQADALARVYRGSINPRTNALFYPGWPLGSETQLAGLFGTPDQVVHGFVGTLVPWVFGPQYDVTRFDFDKDLDRVDAELGPVMNQVSPDLSAFAAHGGKLIVFHGYADAIVGPLDTINYVERINRAMPGHENFARLYMAPGMAHCTGGEGADSFGQSPAKPQGDAGHDLLTALDAWRDQGHAPAAIIATKFDASGTAQFARPLCPYPAKSSYAGGDAKDPRSFRCVASPGAKFERPAPQYLR
jgi:feruloyl esterase